MVKTLTTQTDEVIKISRAKDKALDQSTAIQQKLADRVLALEQRMLTMEKGKARGKVRTGMTLE